MKRHLRRFGWLYLTLLILAAWPAVLLRVQAVPPLDLPTLRAMAQAIQDEFIAQNPTLKPRRSVDQSGPTLKLPQENTTESAAMARLTSLGGAVFGASILQPDLERFARGYDEELRRWDELAREGIIFFPLLNGHRPESTQQIVRIPNLYPNQELSKARRAQAESKIGTDWPEALRLMESAAGMADPMAYNGLIGYLLAVATRANGYNSYGALLHAGPPLEVCRAALASLAELRRRNPLDDKWAWLAEREYYLQALIYTLTRPADAPRDPNIMEINDASAQRNTLFFMAESLARRLDKIQDPALRARAVSILKMTGQAPVYDARDRLLAISDIGRRENVEAGAGLKWTTAPAIRKWLREMLEREPWVTEQLLANFSSARREELRRTLDPWTVMMVTAVGLNANMLEAGTRGQMAKVRGRLLEAAFAARLMKESRGAWPKTITELAGEFPQLEDKLSTSTLAPGLTFTTATLPALRIAERPITPELRAALWSTVLPMRGFDALTGPNAIQGDGTLDYVVSNAQEEWVKEPVRALALQQAFAAHPALVENAQALITRDDVSQWMNHAQRDAFTWWPLTPLYARVLSGGIDQEELVPLKKELDEMKKAVGWSGELPDDLTKRAVRLKAKLRAPEKAVVIWSPGPDGKDDGGAISYDPSNGTVSRGDLIVFPEKF